MSFQLGRMGTVVPPKDRTMQVTLADTFRAFGETVERATWGRTIPDWEALCRESLKRSQARRRSRARRAQGRWLGFLGVLFVVAVLWVVGVIPS